MERVQTWLCIGGPKDGQRIASPSETMMDVIRFPRMTNGIRTDILGKPAPVFDTVNYRRESLAAIDVVFDVWILDGMTMQDALRSLLANYRPETAVQP